jgi:hypothetical protein
MSYDQVASVFRETYEFGHDQTFGATAVLHYITGPRGCVGFVRDVQVDVTTSLVGTTTVPEIDVGISSGDATFGRYRLGTAASGANAAYGTGPHRASSEAIPGNPPRSATDFAGHVVLDGGPLSTAGSIAGGSATSQNPIGRIPAGPFTVTSVVNGTGNVARLVLKEGIDINLKVGQLVTVQGVSGATGANGVNVAISAIGGLGGAQSNIPNPGTNYIELSGTTFGGTYTTGGFVTINTVITCLAGVGSGAGGGYVRVTIDWYGQPGF